MFRVVANPDIPFRDFMVELQDIVLLSACCGRLDTRRMKPDMKQPNCVAWMRASVALTVVFLSSASSLKSKGD
jgi:hypothetical protein